MEKKIRDLNEKNFSGANLIRASLAEADLQGMNFYMAQLTRANLRGANLVGAEFGGADLRGADLSGARLGESILYRANLKDANLRGARLCNADLRGANLNGADLSEADFGVADLSAADLSGANLCGAKLMGTRLVASNFQEADLTGCQIYGAFTWNVKLQDARQFDIVVTPPGEPVVAVDGLEAAQSAHALLNHKHLRDMLDPAASRFALIVGNFASERKSILDGIRHILRSGDCIPISLDFGKSDRTGLQDSLSALLHMARFVVADFTNAGSLAQELGRILTESCTVSVIPLLQSSKNERETFEQMKRYPQLAEIHRYTEPEDLCRSLEQDINISTPVNQMN
jgi:uncharacterized protein YjbI with pentapeptide repeats